MPTRWKTGRSSALMKDLGIDQHGRCSGQAAGTPAKSFHRKSLFVKANGFFKLENDGYWGMNIVQGSRYAFKLAARSMEGFNVPLKIRIIGSDERNWQRVK